jgi:predicted metal-dependent hydrolase
MIKTTYSIKYSNRKTLGVYITKKGSIEVRAPNHTSKKTIEMFLKKHDEWINNHYLSIHKKNQQQAEFNIKFGNTLLLLGNHYPIISIEEEKSGFNGKEFYCYHELIQSELKNEMIKTYQCLAKNIINEQVKITSSHMNLKPLGVKINSAKTRWGSCSSKGNLNFSWYLIMADEATIQYVVVHELTHLIEMNHSKKFWKIVEEVLPNYREEKKKLRSLQEILRIENWDKI